MTAPVLRVEALSVTHAGGARAVRAVDLEVAGDRVLGLVGESGCGKSTLLRAVVRLLPDGARTGGTVDVAGRRVVGPAAPGEAEVRALRGRVVGYLGQDPYGAFDPRLTLRAGLAEAWRAAGFAAPHDEIARRLAALGVDEAPSRLRQRPHQWSGGMLTRAAIVAATAHAPTLLLADEPTAALDAALVDAVLTALRPPAGSGRAAVLVSHDLGGVAPRCDDVAVMYAGRIVEHGPAVSVLARPRHPYTAGLVAATPRRGAGLPVPLPGEPPPADAEPPGCGFAPRCARVVDRCRRARPELVDGVACWRPW